MKELRKALAPKKIKFFHSGEYGEPTPENDFIARPHYHALIFNHQFSDRECFQQNEGIALYASDTLDSIWKRGYTSVGDLTFESAAYVARYVMKKINGDLAYEHYTRTDHTTGEVLHVSPEYSTMSRKPGIGKTWFDEFHSDCYPSDNLHVRGVLQKPPKYYDYLYDNNPLFDFEPIRQARKVAARKQQKDATPERLATRELVKLAQIKNLKRKLTYET